MTTLRETQDAMLGAMLGGPVPEFILADGLAPEERVGIYRNTYVGGLTTALRLSYPAVRRLVGEEFFDGAAQLFIAGHPPARADLNTYGSDFADFLANFPPAASVTYLADVARLEWAVNMALHAPDSEPAIVSTDIGGAGVRADASLSVLRSTWPVDAIWTAVLAENDDALQRIDLDAGPVFLTVAREHGTVQVTRFDKPAWDFTAALHAGLPLELAMSRTGEIDAANLLALHLAAGRLRLITNQESEI